MAERLSDRNRVEIITERLEGDLWRVSIVAYDYLGELSVICGLLFAYGLSIVDGHVFTYEPQIADGRWPMADSRWQMADGRGSSAQGRQLAEAVGHSPQLAALRDR